MNDEFQFNPTGQQPSNPYAAPLAPVGPTEDRSGPDWERQGGLVSRFFSTTLAGFSGPTEFFRQMRTSGGLLAPAGFAILANTLFGGLGAALETLLDSEVAPDERLMTWLYLGVGILLLPFLNLINLFLMTAVMHAALIGFGGANRSFETTLRVIAYAIGCTAPGLLIPHATGNLIVAVVQIVFIIKGLTIAHETSSAKSAAAVLIPFLFCVGLAILGIWQLDRSGLLEQIMAEM